MKTIAPIQTKDIYSETKPLKIDETVQGTIIGVGRSSVFLDLGIQGAGIIFGKEFIDAKHQLEKLKKGDKISAKVVGLENEDGYFELSVARASKEIVWKDLQSKKEKGETIKIKITGANKGGLLANVGDIPGFLPVSQLSSSHYPQVKNADQSKILQELQKFIGLVFEVKILEFMPKQGKLVFSEKAKEFENIEEILKSHNEGDIIEGVITKIVNFGIFVKFPTGIPDSDENKIPKEIEGLIHISELDWELVDDVNKNFKVGQKIKAKINKIAQGKVSLSIKALKPNPWEKAEKEYKKGDKVKGEVVKLNPFGVLVKLPAKIQGLCHISEFATKAEMEERMRIGQTYDFEIISFEPKEHKILLRHYAEEK